VNYNGFDSICGYVGKRFYPSKSNKNNKKHTSSHFILSLRHLSNYFQNRQFKFSTRLKFRKEVPTEYRSRVGRLKPSLCGTNPRIHKSHKGFYALFPFPRIKVESSKIDDSNQLMVWHPKITDYEKIPENTIGLYA
jgi:hypothetical protein